MLYVTIVLLNLIQKQAVVKVHVVGLHERTRESLAVFLARVSSKIIVAQTNKPKQLSQSLTILEIPVHSSGLRQYLGQDERPNSVQEFTYDDKFSL